MGKHRTSASLGHPNQYTSPASSEPMPEPENIYTKVESLERRVSMLEGLLNDVMHQMRCGAMWGMVFELCPSL